MKRLSFFLLTLFGGIITGMILEKRVPKRTATAPTESARPSEPPRKSRTAEDMSPTYKAHRDYYLSKEYVGGAESPGKHERRFNKVLSELDLTNLTEMEAVQIKKALGDLFTSTTYQMKELIENYNIPFYEEE